MDSSAKVNLVISKVILFLLNGHKHGQPLRWPASFEKRKELTIEYRVQTVQSTECNYDYLFNYLSTFLFIQDG